MRQIKHPPARESGMVLLTVLLISTFLFTLLFDTVGQQRFQLQRHSNYLHLQEAFRNAESTIGMVDQVLLMDRKGSDYDHLGELWATKMPVPEIDDGQLSIIVEDRSRYWNINRLVTGNGQINEQMRGVFARLLQRQGLDESLLDPVIDWIDQDNLPTGYSGAEMDSYIDAGLVYRPANGAMRTLDELTLVLGWDRNKVDKIRHLVQANSDCPGTGLNINTASYEALFPLLPYWSHADIEGIILQREESPFRTVGDLIQHPAYQFMEIPQALLSTGTDCFQTKVISRVGEVGGVMKTNMKRMKHGVEVTRIRWSQ